MFKFVQSFSHHRLFAHSIFSMYLCTFRTGILSTFRRFIVALCEMLLLCTANDSFDFFSLFCLLVVRLLFLCSFFFIFSSQIFVSRGLCLTFAIVSNKQSVLLFLQVSHRIQLYPSSENIIRNVHSMVSPSFVKVYFVFSSLFFFHFVFIWKDKAKRRGEERRKKNTDHYYCCVRAGSLAVEAVETKWIWISRPMLAIANT